jgi:ABC-type polysaccharide/polyol phosphate export permease
MSTTVTTKQDSDTHPLPGDVDRDQTLDGPEAAALSEAPRLVDESSVEIVRPTFRADARAAFKDLVEGFFLWRIWWTMAVLDIKRRYRRTAIGPFWTTLSHAIFIGSTGLIFSSLWHQDVTTYLPFLASGFVCWVFVSSIITEAGGIFVSAGATLQQTRLPYSVFIYQLVARNLLVMAHHMVVFVVLLMFFPVKVTFYTLLFFPALAILCAVGVWTAILVGMLCVRYRDVQQIINSFLQIIMFVTPIFWAPDHLGRYQRWLVEPNLIYHCVNLVRAPLLGGAPLLSNWIAVTLFLFGGGALTFILYARFRRFLIFWA